MSFVLSSGSFSSIERAFSHSFNELLSARQDALREQHLVLVPSAALRKHLLRLLFDTDVQSLTGVRLVSLSGLAQEIVLDSLQEPYSALDDPIYFLLALQSTARRLNLADFYGYRTTRALLSTVRDLVDGLLTPDLLEQFLQEGGAGNKRLQEISAVYRTFLQDLNSQNVINIQYAPAYALQNIAQYVQAKNIRALHVYGFYDATPAQFELIETFLRQVLTLGGAARMYFPFGTATNTVEHPGEYSQEFFDQVRSLTDALGGLVVELPNNDRTATGGLENRLFTGESAEPAASDSIEIFNCGSPYEEAWAVAKKVLHLVLKEGVRFDQIGVLTRSLDTCRTAFQHVFAENAIPHSLPVDSSLCSSAAGQFVYLLLLLRQSHLNHNLVFEFLCSPLLREPFVPAGIIRDLLEILFITNGDDWQRLGPLTDEDKKLPEIFEMDEEDPRAAHFRRAATYLVKLKEKIDQIPISGSLTDYSGALLKVTDEFADAKRFEEAGGPDLHILLQRMGDLPLETQFSLNEITEIFKDYLTTTLTGQETAAPPSPVTIGDIMTLRGVAFDYVFITGLNQDVFPLRSSEDSFLPDAVRTVIRATTGAGPHPKKRALIIQEQASGNDEELLLFTLALRSARKKLFLSYQRADADGRKKAPSIYIEEVLRLLSDRTSEDNALVYAFPRHLGDRLKSGYLPAPHECATLVERFSPYEVLPHFYSLQKAYIDNIFAFAGKLNGMDRLAAAEIDGVIEEPRELWNVLFDGKLAFSYSRIKQYVRCGFAFYADRILKLQSSPFKPTEIPHDLTPLVRGRIAESVVKEAVLKLRYGHASVADAVKSVESKIRRKYAPYLPKVLIDYYLTQFSRAALVLLSYLKDEGFDFGYAEVPDRDYMPRMRLLDAPHASLDIYGIPDLLFYGAKKLIGEMKWGASATADPPNTMFTKGELQFCFYPELERQSRQLLEAADFRYFRLNIFGELGSPENLEQKLRLLGAPAKLDTTLRLFGSSPSQLEISENFEKLKDLGRDILGGDFKILEDPNDYWSPCTTCEYILTCRRTHSATLLRAKKESSNDDDSSDIL